MQINSLKKKIYLYTNRRSSFAVGFGGGKVDAARQLLEEFARVHIIRCTVHEIGFVNKTEFIQI